MKSPQFLKIHSKRQISNKLEWNNFNKVQISMKYAPSFIHFHINRLGFFIAVEFLSSQAICAQPAIPVNILQFPLHVLPSTIPLFPLRIIEAQALFSIPSILFIKVDLLFVNRDSSSME